MEAPKDLTISEAFDLYRDDVIYYQNQSAKTEEMSALAAKSIINYLGDIPISELDFKKIRSWSADLGRTRSQNTVRGYILKLRVVVRHLNKLGYNCMDYEAIGIPKRDSHVADFLEVNEVQELLHAAFAPSNGYSTFKRYRNRAIIALLFSAGLRNSELCQLNREQFHPGADTFTVIGKGDKPRPCFIDETTQQYIQEYLAHRTDNYQALFTSEQKKGRERLHPGAIQYIVKNCAKKAGLSSSVHPHTLRHSFATDLLRKNTNIAYIRDLLGHASIQVTMTYTHIVNEDLREIHHQHHSVVYA